MRNKKIFLVLLLILSLVVFSVACSTNGTPNVPNTTNNNGTGNDYNNGTGTDNGTGGTSSTGGITNNTNQ